MERACDTAIEINNVLAFLESFGQMLRDPSVFGKMRGYRGINNYKSLKRKTIDITSNFIAKIEEKLAQRKVRHKAVDFPIFPLSYEHIFYFFASLVRLALRRNKLTECHVSYLIRNQGIRSFVGRRDISPFLGLSALELHFSTQYYDYP